MSGLERAVSGPLPRMLTLAQIASIARQEGANPDVVEEALRRMRENPHVRRGEVRSPGAFFRGIIRGVQADRAMLVSQAAPPTSSQGGSSAVVAPRGRTCEETATPADRTASRMALRARSLFAAGDHDEAVRDQLCHEFPQAPPDLVAWAVVNGFSLFRALSH